jgi:hypothetical protein
VYSEDQYYALLNEFLQASCQSCIAYLQFNEENKEAKITPMDNQLAAYVRLGKFMNEHKEHFEEAGNVHIQ